MARHEEGKHMSEDRNYWQKRLDTGRFTRRRFVGGTAVAGVGAASLALVGCGGDDSSNTTANKTTASGGTAAAGQATATATPKKGGVYTTAFTGPFAGADPHNSVYGGAGIVPQVYNYLFRDLTAIAPERGIIYDLAQSHQLQPDNVTMVFKLRPDAKVAPNTQGIPERPLDSSDVLASWQRIADPKVGSNAYFFTNNWIDKMDAPDPQTFRMILKSPYAWTEATVGNNLYGAIVPKELLSSPDLKTKPVGGGPFKLSELVEGDHAKMDKNPNFWRQGYPYLDSEVIRAFADQTTWLTAYTSGQVDYYAATNQDEAKQVQANVKDTAYFHELGTGYLSFWMNTKSTPWTDPRVRQAVNLATNRDEYIQLIGHGVGEPMGPLSPIFGKFVLTKEELAKAQPFNVADAKKLFDAAGIKEITFSHPTSSNVNDYVTIFVRQMQAAGVTAKPQPLDAGTWVAGYFTSKLTASLSLNQSYQHPDVPMQWYYTGGITGNGHYDTGFSDPDVDTAIKKAAGTLDETQRVAAYKAAQNLILSKSPPFINFFGIYSDLLVAPAIHGFQPKVGSLQYAYIQEFWRS